MFDPNKPVITRDGRPARIIATDIKGDTEGKIIALIDTGDEEILAIRLASGRCNDDVEDAGDLINTRVEYRAFDIDSGGRLGCPVEEPNHVARGYPWNDKILKFTIAHGGEVVGVELA